MLAAVSTSRCLSTSCRLQAAAKAVPQKKAKSQLFKYGRAKKGDDSVSTDISRNIKREDLPNPNFPQLATTIASGSTLITPVKFDQSIATVTRHFGLPRALKRRLEATASPCTVLRKATHDLVDELEKAASTQSGSSVRRFITGSTGTGKSTLLLQTVNWATENGWIVIYIPNAAVYINSSSDYIHATETDSYDQPTASNDLLRAILEVNKSLLSRIKTEEGASLSEIITSRLKQSPADSAKLLRQVVGILSAQTDIPILFAIDSVQSLFGPSLYTTRTGTRIDSFQLSSARLLLDLLSNKVPISCGAIVAATSASDLAHQSRALDLSLGLAKPLHAYDREQNSAYGKYAHGVARTHLEGSLTREEARGIAELASESRLARNVLRDDTLIMNMLASQGRVETLAKAF